MAKIIGEISPGASNMQLIEDAFNNQSKFWLVHDDAQLQPVFVAEH